MILLTLRALLCHCVFVVDGTKLLKKYFVEVLVDVAMLTEQKESSRPGGILG